MGIILPWILGAASPQKRVDCMGQFDCTFWGRKPQMTPDLYFKSSDTEAAAQTQPSIMNRDTYAVPSAHYNTCVAGYILIGGAAGLCGGSGPTLGVRTGAHYL